jgi:predicted permease
MIKLWRRIVWAVRFRRADADLAAELEFHRAERQAALERTGMARDDARAESRRAMGNVALAREDARGVWLAPWCESAAQDVAYGLRLLRRTPSFAIAMVTVIALGIGATTTIFALLDALVLKDLPVRDPDSLVYFKDPAFSYPIFQQVKARSSAVLSDVTAWDVDRFSVQWSEALEPTDVLSASGEFYALLGISPAAGRLFGPADDRVGGGADGRVAVISYDAWRRRFDGDPGVIGHIVRIAGKPFTIVGVAPPGFFGVAAGLAPDLTVPIATMRDAEALMRPTSSWLHLLARLQSGVAISQANAALDTFWPAALAATVGTGIPAERRAMYIGRRTTLMPARTGFSRIRNQYEDPLWMLLALVTLLLAVACASAANLWLARSVARRREIAVRLAIGAGRGRLVRQMLTEAALTTAIGAAAGGGLASWGGAALVAMMSTSSETISLDLRINARVLAFTALLTIISTALAAIVPALTATRAHPAGSLKQHATVGGTVGRWSRALVVIQIALTAMLLVGAALFARSLDRIVSRDAGFDRHDVIVVLTDAVAAEYRGARLRDYYDALLRRLSSAAGVECASLSQYPPISDQLGSWTQSIGVDGGRLQAATSHERSVYFNGVSPGYFRTLGMRLLQGRDFTASDVESASRVVVINESLARSAFPGQNPVGHRISIGRAEARKDLEIIGLVPDSKYQRLQEPARPIAYVPFAQIPDLLAGENLVAEVRAHDLRAVRAAVARTVREIDPRVPVRVETIDGRIRESLVRERVMAVLAAALGGAALLLACAAVYGLLSYSVTRRTSEFGVRFALGATPAAIVTMVLRGSLILMAGGLAAGLAAAAALGRFSRTLLFDLQPLDPTSFAVATAILVTVTTVAALLPARRAARVDPVIALRSE